MVIPQARVALDSFNAWREWQDCFVNFYLFASTRGYRFHTIVSETRMNSLCEIYILHYLFTI
jgi:hypothetical protein